MKLGHSIGQEEYNVVYDFLSNTTHPVIISPALNSFKEEFENSNKAINDDLLIDLSVLSDIQIRYFANEQYKFSKDGFRLFYNCISKTDPKVYLRQEALDIMKDEIQKDPKGYFRMFIRTEIINSPEYNIVSPEPFCAQIFGDYRNFEKFLEKCKDNNQYIIRVKNFWELYKNNGYESIEFRGQGNVQEKIDNCFIKEIEQLNQLKQIMEQLKTDWNISNELKQMLESNNLNIKLRTDINKELTRIHQY